MYEAFFSDGYCASRSRPYEVSHIRYALHMILNTPFTLLFVLYRTIYTRLGKIRG